MSAVFYVIGRVDGLHAEVEAEDEKVHVHSDTRTIGYGYFAEETVKSEGSARLFLIFA